jgi:hypothetical protein
MMIEYLSAEIEDLVVPEAAPYFEALGAALWALENDTAPPPPTSALFRTQGSQFDALPPLRDFEGKVEFKSIAGGRIRPGDECILGLDVGSTTTKAVLLRSSDDAMLASVYLRTNGTVGLLFKHPLSTTPTIDVPLPNSDWEYRPSVFFIRKYADSVGDGIPTLCKKVLGGAQPGMTTECLAAGIEDLQVEYGIDTSGDGFANAYVADPTQVQMQTVVSARIFLLARTVENDIRYDNDKTYNVSNAVPFTPGDNFHRRVLSTTVAIQNIRSLNSMGF